MQLQAATDGRQRLEERLAEAQGRLSEVRDQLERAHAAAATERQRTQQEISSVHSDLNAIAEERYQLQARSRAVLLGVLVDHVNMDANTGLVSL